MSAYFPPRQLPRRFQLVLASFLQHPALPFANVITEESIDRAMSSCVAAVAREAVLLVAWNFETPPRPEDQGGVKEKPCSRSSRILREAAIGNAPPVASGRLGGHVPAQPTRSATKSAMSAFRSPP
jgi:hypothetical protein